MSYYIPSSPWVFVSGTVNSKKNKNICLVLIQSCLKTILKLIIQTELKELGIETVNVSWYNDVNKFIIDIITFRFATLQRDDDYLFCLEFVTVFVIHFSLIADLIDFTSVTKPNLSNLIVIHVQLNICIIKYNFRQVIHKHLNR